MNDDTSTRSFDLAPFDADRITTYNWAPMLRVRAKPIVVHATRLNFPEGFCVATKSGKLHGRPGDYLVIGVGGEKYVMDEGTFAQMYDMQEEP